MGYLGVFACWLMSGTFGVAAIAKLRNAAEFEASVAALRLVSTRLVRATGITVIFGELSISALCLVPVARTATIGLILGAGFLLAFALAAMSARVRRRVVPCRCFGRRGAPLGVRHAVCDGVLAAVAVAGVAVLISRPVPDSAAGLLLVAAVSAVAVMFVVALDDVVELFRPTER